MLSDSLERFISVADVYDAEIWYYARCHRLFDLFPLLGSQFCTALAIISSRLGSIIYLDTGKVHVMSNTASNDRFFVPAS